MLSVSHLSVDSQTPSAITASRKALLHDSTLVDPQSVRFSEEGPFHRQQMGIPQRPAIVWTKISLRTTRNSSPQHTH